MLRETEPPAFVALVGKPRTYDTDDGNTNVSLRPEHLTVVDEQTRNRWVTETANRTLERLERFDDETNEYATMAREHYDSPADQYRQTVIQAVEELTSDAETTPTPNSEPEDGDPAESTTAGGSDPTASTTESSSGSSIETSTDKDNTSQSGDEIGDFDSSNIDSER
jgi:hypothetical protein